MKDCKKEKVWMLVASVLAKNKKKELAITTCTIATPKKSGKHVVMLKVEIDFEQVYCYIISFIFEKFWCALLFVFLNFQTK